MLPSIGFPEMLVIVLLAIIFVGPKDLPQLMRTIGQWMARIKAMGNEFKSAFDDMDIDNEVSAIRREIEEMKSMGTLAPDLDNEMRELNEDIRKGADLSSPHTPDQKPIESKPKDETPSDE
jgi:sec-independent protein translocase protein TatB